MTVHDYQKLFRTKIDPMTVYACDYLELKGLRFGVEFGFVDAVRKATDMVMDELEVDYGV
jgi:hypothetical protein